MLNPVVNKKKNNTEDHSQRIIRYLNVLDIDHHSPEKFAASLPFSLNDITAGSENELQAVVIGNKNNVDLPLFIQDSNYYKNLLKQAESGDTSPRLIADLKNFIHNNTANVWENSWVRFPRSAISAYAFHVFNVDLSSDKSDASSLPRKDKDKFLFYDHGKEHVRIPVSYLLKLSLADAISTDDKAHPMIKVTGERLMHFYLNDNTSPELVSFYPTQYRTAFGTGNGLAKETLKRFILTQLLSFYANRKFELSENGQQAMVYFASHPPVRQKLLNDLISDSFYREIFMSPCLSGWDRGEEKYRYMGLCHKVLSRSQMNAVRKLKNCGIITSNLVVLPNMSNISLANNGTHISLGSRKLTALMKDGGAGFAAVDEKYLGDLVIKIIEHFLPLFVGNYSAAPYRLNFHDFHPEKILGFLPHELDETHLRMIWRRWKKKGHLQLLGHSFTPFGPLWLDKLFSRLFHLKGDFIADFRLIDYLTILPSTSESSALNGKMGNEQQLLSDLKDLGIFHPQMPLYLLYRTRKYTDMGFSGFEGRFYSTFYSIMDDMGCATSLQSLLNALAYKYILLNEITHEDIPDTPFIESERRQIFFGTAIGIPTFYAHKATPNAFMRKILKKTHGIRNSRRYPGFLRIKNTAYHRALLEIIKEDGRDLIEMLNLHETVTNLEMRVEKPEIYSTGAKLQKGVQEHAGISDPFKLSGMEFNAAMESYYRNDLRKAHIEEALKLLKEDFNKLDMWADFRDNAYKDALKHILHTQSASEFLEATAKGIAQDTLSVETLRRLIHLTILSIHADQKQSENR